MRNAKIYLALAIALIGILMLLLDLGIIPPNSVIGYAIATVSSLPYILKLALFLFVELYIFYLFLVFATYSDNKDLISRIILYIFGSLFMLYLGRANWSIFWQPTAVIRDFYSDRFIEMSTSNRFVMIHALILILLAVGRSMGKTQGLPGKWNDTKF
jgi:hypothetical protein